MDGWVSIAPKLSDRSFASQRAIYGCFLGNLSCIAPGLRVQCEGGAYRWAADGSFFWDYRRFRHT
jgi:hypothetical protein